MSEGAAPGSVVFAILVFRFWHLALHTHTHPPGTALGGRLGGRPPHLCLPMRPRMQKRILGSTFHLKDTMCLGYTGHSRMRRLSWRDSRAVSFVTRSILDATSIYRCTAVLRYHLHTRSHFTILGQGSVSGDTVCVSGGCTGHRAPRGDQGARKGGVISRHPPLGALP